MKTGTGENITLEQVATLLDSGKIKLRSVSERFKAVLEVWLVVWDGNNWSDEYRVILKDTTEEDFEIATDGAWYQTKCGSSI